MLYILRHLVALFSFIIHQLIRALQSCRKAHFEFLLCNSLNFEFTKDVSKANKKKAEVLADTLSAHLREHGWAVCDNFLSLDLVRRVRIEAELFKDFYEQSEIWVGKKADVGAHLQVPSVRGDRVLWMCGGHQGMAPEGVTRHVKTKGELEPCKLNVKAHAPMRKFAALKELVGNCDTPKFYFSNH